MTQNLGRVTSDCQDRLTLSTLIGKNGELLMVPENNPSGKDKDALEQLLDRNVAHLHGRTTTWQVPFDVKETSREVVVIIDLPGVEEDDIRVDVKDAFLEVEALREFDHDNEDAEEYTHLERPYGRLRCRVPLPESIDAEEITAKYRRGVLKVRMPWMSRRKA